MQASCSIEAAQRACVAGRGWLRGAERRRVAQAVETLAGIVKLQNYHTFSLFECRKYVVRKLAEAAPEEVPDDHIFLDDHKCVAPPALDFAARLVESIRRLCVAYIPHRGHDPPAPLPWAGV
jgi:hypothetical protein